MSTTAVAAPAALPPSAPGDAATPIPFLRLLRVEWRKQLDTRAARWLLLASLGLSVVAVLIPLLRPQDVAQDYASYLELMVLGVTVLVPVIAILTLTSEWTRRTVLSTFTQEPRRARVITAKILAGLGLAALSAAVGYGLAAAGLALSDGLGRQVSWTVAPRELVGFAALVLLNALMAMAFGVLLHNTAAAIVLFFVLPMLFSLLGMVLRGIRDWIDTGVTLAWILEGDWGANTPKILTSLAVWIVLPLVAGLVRTSRREVS